MVSAGHGHASTGCDPDRLPRRRRLSAEAPDRRRQQYERTVRDDLQTGAYAARRRGEGKSVREIRRCLKHAVARQLFKLLERHDRSTVELLQVG